MKKIVAILFSFVGVGLIACLIIGFCQKLDVELVKKSVFLYKLCSGFELFTKILPGMILAGFTLACSIYFGHASEGSMQRFSMAMLKRYKYVMIISLISVFLLTFSTEVISTLVIRTKSTLSTQRYLVNEYVRVGNDFLLEGKPQAAAVYAQEALALDSGHEGAIDLKNRAEIEISLQETKRARFTEGEAIDTFVFSKQDSDINKQKLMDVYDLYKKSEMAFEKEDWFNAHYYAESALKIATGKDINVQDLKYISATSWNNLTRHHNLTKSNEQDLFNQKYLGYKALMEEDYLKSYYIFKNLQLENEEFEKDSDVNFYIKIAESKINEKTFFTDETFDMKSFENANNIYFTLKYDDGSSDIIYFKGVTSVKTAGDTVQYLRALTIKSMDKNGSLFRSMSVPYAKVLVISLRDMSALAKKNMGIAPDINFVPYIMLKSVDRVAEGVTVEPEYTYADSSLSGGPDYLILPMSFADFQLVEGVSLEPELTQLGTLYKFVTKANEYGYAPEVFGQAMLDRLLYPLFMLMVFVLLASVAWNNRLGANQYFKTLWVLLFPIFAVLCHFFYEMMMFIFKLINYAFFLSAGAASLLWGIFFYVICLISSSLFFLSRRADF